MAPPTKEVEGFGGAAEAVGDGGPEVGVVGGKEDEDGLEGFGVGFVEGGVEEASVGGGVGGHADGFGGSGEGDVDRSK